MMVPIYGAKFERTKPFPSASFSGKPDKSKKGRRKMSEHKHGSMDIHSQQKAYAGFIKGGIWLCIISAAILVFLAIFNS